VVQRPSPDQYNPPLTWRAHLWRMALAVSFSGLLWWFSAPTQWQQARWLFWLDLSLGIVALVATLYRRRWPLGVAVLTSVLGAFSITANGPGTLAKVSLATRRVVWQIVLVCILDLVPSATIPLIQPGDNRPVWIDFILGLLSAVAMLMFGMYIGSRRELMWTLRDRADRAEAEQHLRVEQGQLQERARIAREMHDVLAHRISLIAVHAGALAYRTDLTDAEKQQTAELIRAASHEAISDLRQVLGVLRDAHENGSHQRPQPTFDDLVGLVEEAEGAGMRIDYDDRVADAGEMPDQVGRTAYRIVQEGLTNARKHAPGVTVLVEVSGSSAAGLSIRMRNPDRGLRPSPGARTPGAGLGLVGLGERAKLAGGHVTTRRDGGSFELSGWLPWTA
jgi:signal transduction histidine kinase